MSDAVLRVAKLEGRTAIAMRAAHALAKRAQAVAREARNLVGGDRRRIQAPEEQALTSSPSPSSRGGQRARDSWRSSSGRIRRRRSPIEWIAKLDARTSPSHSFRCGSRRGFAVAMRHRPDELLVRIYPDALLADTHEPVVTAVEVEVGGRIGIVLSRAIERRRLDALLARRRRRAPPGSCADHAVNISRPSSGRQRAWHVERPLSPSHAPDGLASRPEARGLPERWIVSPIAIVSASFSQVSGPVREGLALTIRLTGDGAPEARPSLSISPATA